MRKRYWIIGIVLFYAISRLMGGGPSGGDAGVAKVPTVSDGAAQPQPDAIETSKTVSETTLSETAHVDLRNFEREKQAEVLPVRFVAGKRVAFRKGPSTGGEILDRLDNGRKVLLISQSSDWSNVRDELTQRDGWVASRFLGETPKLREEKRSEKAAKAKEPAPVPTIPESTIIQRIIEESLASYPSSCACPYNTDRGGRRCGKRSAYSKPGGYAPICYAEDVSQTMIDAYRR